MPSVNAQRSVISIGILSFSSITGYFAENLKASEQIYETKEYPKSYDYEKEFKINWIKVKKNY